MRQEKQYLLDEVQGQIQSFGSFVMISYAGLEANKLNIFRRQVRKMNGGVEFVKKRLLIKAAQNLGYTIDLDALPGHIGLIMAKEEPLELTKFVFKFRQENEKQVNVVGGRIDGVMYNGNDVETLSKLPSKDEMRAQLLATFEAPQAQTLAVMEALILSVPYCLDNKIKQSEETKV
jgi:large subunit ribosomal protein L10